jgi:hypothetical protein
VQIELEGVLARVDRFAGGSQASLVVDDAARTHPRTVRTFTIIAWLLVLEAALSLALLVTAVALATHGDHVPLIVWPRAIAVLGITLSLFYFCLRARSGRYWAYRRLSLFSRIFPVVALVLAAVPGLYPIWMTFEQVVFALVLIGIGLYLRSAHMRAVFARPDAAVRRRRAPGASPDA